MEDMYKQAILDAKAVRASAMANAKASLQEAFEPKIQEMIRMKLSEELEEEMEEEGYNEMEEAMQDEATDEAKDTMEEIDEASLEEILAELDELEGEKKTEEGKAHDEIMEEEDEEESEEDTESEETEEEETEDEEESEEGEPVEDDTKVIDITLGDLKQVLQSVMGQSSEGGEIDLGGDMPTDEEPMEEMNLDLDEILAELDKTKEKVEEKKSDKEEDSEKSDWTVGEEIIGSKKHYFLYNQKTGKRKGMYKSKEEAEKLQEAQKTIAILRSELNEVNLLNAKLLYMNKIFKSKNLSESQKINVVSALDRATNVKEAKNIYETLKENLHSKKSQIQESRGFASNPAGVAPKKVIVEADAFVSRWQKIAGIK